MVLGSVVVVLAALVALGILLLGLLRPVRRLAAARHELVGTLPRVRTLAVEARALRRDPHPAGVASGPSDREGSSS